jgi:hypothetical protein
MRRYSLILVASLACQGRPQITSDQVASDLVGRTIGEGWSGWRFQPNERRTVKVVEVKRTGDAATVVIDLVTESRPLPMPTFPPSTPWPTPPPPTLNLPTIDGVAPPTLPTMAPSTLIPRLILPTPPSRKWGGRLRLQYEWIAGQWSLVKIENLGFKPLDGGDGPS